MSIVENDNSDILWIDTHLPIIACIYYHLYLNSKYTLYCPDNITTTNDNNNNNNNNNSTIDPPQQHVRDLVRDILKVADKNSHKKLALYFLKPISSTKKEDFLRFLHKRRANLNISFLTLPYGSIQQYTLSGWIYTLNKSDFNIWFKQNLILQPSPCSPPPITLDNIYIDHQLNQPFLITANHFIKKAFIVDICSNMIQITDDKIEFNSTTINAINGYMDAAISSEQGSTIILIGHEYSFFTENENLVMQHSDVEQTKQLLENKQKKIWNWIESLATSFPIYLFLNGYHKLNNQKLHHSLAWLHHRHHLSISKSIVLTWKAHEFDSNCPHFLTQIHCMDLIGTARFTRNKWKKDFILILNEIKDKSTSEELLQILPSKLNITTTESWIAPLYDSGSPFMSTKLECNDSFIHSVSSLTEEIASIWKNKNYENWIQYKKTNEHNLVIEDTITEEEMNINKLESISLNITHEVIMNYIANTGAYSRGEKLLGTLDSLSYSWNDNDDLLLFTKAQGTSNVPYKVYLCINQYIKDNRVIKDGYCTCPVGKNGRCKHCTALLLRFIINMEEFDQSKKPIIIPNVDNQITSTKSETKDNNNNNNNNNNNSESVALTSINQGTDNNISAQANDQSDKDVIQIEKRRVLPWVLGKNKHNEEEKEEKKEQEEEKDDMDQPPCKKKQKTDNTKRTPKKSELTKNDITISTSSDYPLKIDSKTTKETKYENKNNNTNSKSNNNNNNNNKNHESDICDSNSDDSNNGSEFRDVYIDPKDIKTPPKRSQRKAKSEKKVKTNNVLSPSPSSSATDYIMIGNGSPSSPSLSSPSKAFMDHRKQSPIISYSPLNDFEEENQEDDSSKYKNSDISFSFLSMDEASSSLFSDPVPQGSTISLPLTDLALSMQTQVNNEYDDDETEDEEYEEFLREQKRTSISQQNDNDSSIIDNEDNELNGVLKMSTSDIFDELGL